MVNKVEGGITHSSQSRLGISYLRRVADPDKALENIRFLDPYKRMQFDPEETQWILANLAVMGSAPVHFLLVRHLMGEYRAAGIAHVWHLLATRQIDCDINLPLNERTELWGPQ